MAWRQSAKSLPERPLLDDKRQSRGIRLPAIWRPRWKSKLMEPRSAHCRSSSRMEQGSLAGQHPEHAGVLLKEVALLYAGIVTHRDWHPSNQFGQPGQPVRTSQGICPGAVQQGQARRRRSLDRALARSTSACAATGLSRHSRRACSLVMAPAASRGSTSPVSSSSASRKGR